MSTSFTERALARCTWLAYALALGACTASAPAPDPAAPPVVDPEIEARFDRALEALNLGEFEAAESELLALTTDQPALAAPWVNLGHLYATTGRAAEAVHALETAVALEPQSCAPYNELGVLARRAGDFAGAERNYREGLAADPRCPEAMLNLGILYELYFGRLADALEAYRAYQNLADEPDPRVAGWVVDLERRTGP